MCVPLLHDEKSLGVLNVLDRASQFTLEEMELLGLFANQAAIGLDLLQRARRAQAVLAESGDDAEALARVASLLEGENGDAGRKLLGALEELLRHERSRGGSRRPDWASQNVESSPSRRWGNRCSGRR